MVSEAFFITLVGMGGVFAFLILLIGAMSVLRIYISKTTESTSEKIAVAIATALNQE